MHEPSTLQNEDTSVSQGRKASWLPIPAIIQANNAKRPQGQKGPLSSGISDTESCPLAQELTWHSTAMFAHGLCT